MPFPNVAVINALMSTYGELESERYIYSVKTFDKEKINHKWNDFLLNLKIDKLPKKHLDYTLADIDKLLKLIQALGNTGHKAGSWLDYSKRIKVFHAIRCYILDKLNIFDLVEKMEKKDGSGEIDPDFILKYQNILAEPESHKLEEVFTAKLLTLIWDKNEILKKRSKENKEAIKKHRKVVAGLEEEIDELTRTLAFLGYIPFEHTENITHCFPSAGKKYQYSNPNSKLPDVLDPQYHVHYITQIGIIRNNERLFKGDVVGNFEADALGPDYAEEKAVAEQEAVVVNKRVVTPPPVTTPVNVNKDLEVALSERYTRRSLEEAKQQEQPSASAALTDEDISARMQRMFSPLTIKGEESEQKHSQSSGLSLFKNKRRQTRNRRLFEDEEAIPLADLKAAFKS